MHTILFNESFSFCSRDDLERLQPVSQSLLDIIVAGSNVLPLRPIPRVEMGFHNIKIFAQILSSARYNPDPDYVASLLEGDFKETFHRLQHTCIQDFNVWIIDSPFLRYWKEQEAAAFTVVKIECERTYDTDAAYWEAYYAGVATDPPDTTDYNVLDSIVNHLRPKTADVYVTESSWQENGLNKELVARDSFLKHLQTCDVIVGPNAFPPPGFFLNEPGYPNYELWCGHGQIADGVDRFIESFIRYGCFNKKLESVYIKWYDSEGHQSPAPKQLSGEPTKTDVPPPNIDTKMCDVHSFKNTEQRKKMDVYKWSVDRGADWFPRTIHILLCRVETL